MTIATTATRTEDGLPVVMSLEWWTPHSKRNTTHTYSLFFLANSRLSKTLIAPPFDKHVWGRLLPWKPGFGRRLPHLMLKWKQKKPEWDKLSPDFFRLLLSNCLNWKIYCDDHSSLSSTTAVQNELFHILYIIKQYWGYGSIKELHNVQRVLERKNCRDLIIIPVDLVILEEMAFIWACHERFWWMIKPFEYCPAPHTLQYQLLSEAQTEWIWSQVSFNYPFDLCDKTRLEFEKIHTKDKSVQYRAKLATKRNDTRLNNHQIVQLQGWRA